MLARPGPRHTCIRPHQLLAEAEGRSEPLRADGYQARGTTGEPLVYKSVVNFLMLKLDVTSPCQLALAG